MNKRFVLKMELLEDSQHMRVYSLQLGGLDVAEIPLRNVVPVTPAEYEVAHHLGKMLHPSPFLDLEMVYLNKAKQEFLLFDKEGKWFEEGVNHPLLSLEARYNEHEWLDFTAGPKADINGGNIYTLY